MKFVEHIPAIIRMTVVFAIVLFAIRKKVSLGNSFMIGSVALSIVFAMPVLSTARSMLFSVIDPKTISLALVVSLILVLGSIMESIGQMQRLLARFKGLVSKPALNLVIFPALIGLLPMPGGAVFSAPMVKELGSGSELNGDHLSFINYWYRHIWEYWWPMYPGVLLVTFMSGIELSTFVLMMCPLTIVAVYLGSRPIKGFNLAGSDANNLIKRPPLGPFIYELSPILIVIILGLGLGIFLDKMFPKFTISKETGLIMSLLTATAWIWRENRLRSKDVKPIVFNWKIFNMIYMVIAILVFKQILGDSNAVKAISNELMAVHIPLVLISVILPFIVGLFTGITIAFVGTTFPILISLIHAQQETAFMPAYMMVGLVCGFAGVLLSPLHLCLLMSNEYFGTGLNDSYRYLWMPCAFLLTAGMAYFWILRWIY